MTLNYTPSALTYRTGTAASIEALAVVGRLTTPRRNHRLASSRNRVAIRAKDTSG